MNTEGDAREKQQEEAMAFVGSVEGVRANFDDAVTGVMSDTSNRFRVSDSMSR
jgi:hypothetical protein